MARKAFLAAFFLIFPQRAFAEAKSPDSTFWWALFVPGGGYFYQGETAKGMSYLAATGGMIGWGIAKDKKKEGGEINPPFVYAQQIHLTQIYLSYRESLRKIPLVQTGHYKILKDNSGVSDLALSPVKKENLKSPWVIGFALLGAGINYAQARLEKPQGDYSNISRIKILGDSFNRETGLAAYSGYWIPLSLGAGVSEEALFRGMIQTGWEERWGKTGGLLAASALFGVAHYDGSGPALGNAIFAAAAGTFLGWRFQENHYRLSQSIAAHFWFDALAGLAVYFADPDSNALGAKVEFSF